MSIHPGIVAVATLASLALRPKVELARDCIEVGIPPDQLLEVFRKRFASNPDDILAMEDGRLVRRFAGSEGAFSFRTVEVVRYEENAITFEHLAGPFAECNERFKLAPSASGTTLIHSGAFRLRGGLLSAPLAFGPVKKAFESHVRSHFEDLAREFASE